MNDGSNAKFRMRRWLANLRGAWVAVLLGAMATAATMGGEPPAPAKARLLLIAGNDYIYPNGGHDGHMFNSTTLEILRKMGDFDVTVSDQRNDPTLVEGGLSSYRVILFYGSGGRFNDPKAEQALLDFVDQGGGLVGVHATDAYHDSKIYFSLIGAHFNGHLGGNFWVRITSSQSPVTSGLKDFQTHDEAYRQVWIPGYAHRDLALADFGDNHDPIAWTTEHGKGRVFNTVLGHDRFGYNNPGFLRLVIRGIYWSAGMEPKDPPLDGVKEELP